MHGWLAMSAPTVCCLTDGSGASAEPRIHETRRLLARAGARPGAIFGAVADRAIYDAMLARDVELFRHLVGELTVVFSGVDYVVGDASEGYNPAHDVCRLVIDAAVRRARERSGRSIASYAFPLVGPPRPWTESGPDDVDLLLDDGALARKLEAARNYVALDAEVALALGQLGPEAFRCEAFAHVADGGTVAGDEQPFYERYGEQRVSEGAYARVIRLREHVLPIAEALRCGF